MEIKVRVEEEFEVSEGVFQCRSALFLLNSALHTKMTRI